ncbi:MAG: YdcF family protein [Oscillospiraceae bacterium]|nr:YdcF family protein [Oscillospiraceae bacterium]
MLQIESFLIRFTGAAICLTGVVLFLNAFSLGIRNIGNIFGISVAIVLFVFFAFNRAASSVLQKMWQYSTGKFFVSSIVIFFCTGFLIAFVLSFFMTKEMLNKPDKSYPAVLLGCKVNGTTPSMMLGRRLDAAYDYLTENEDAVIIVSGGQGTGEDISEAECMKKELVRRGISPERILKEDQSTNTSENLSFSKKILEEKGLGNHIVIITDSFHQFRSSLIAHDLSLETNSFNAHTPCYLVLTYWVREWFGIMEQIIFK